MLGKMLGGVAGRGARGVERWQVLGKVWEEGNKNRPSLHIYKKTTYQPAC